MRWLRFPITAGLLFTGSVAWAQTETVSRQPLTESQRRACFATDRVSRVMVREQALTQRERRRIQFYRDHPFSGKLAAFTPAGILFVRPKRYTQFKTEMRLLQDKLKHLEPTSEVSEAEWAQLNERVREVEQQIQLTERVWSTIEDPNPLGESLSYTEGECLPESRPLFSSVEHLEKSSQQWITGIDATVEEQQLADSACREILAQVARKPAADPSVEPKENLHASSGLTRVVQFKEPKKSEKEAFARKADPGANVQEDRASKVGRSAPVPRTPETFLVGEKEDLAELDAIFKQREKERATPHASEIDPAYGLPDRKSILEKAQGFVDRWDKSKPAPFGADGSAELFLASEMYLSPDWRQQATAAYPVLKRKWDQTLSEIRKKHPKTIELQAMRAEMFGSILQEYSAQKALLADALSGQGTNCDGETIGILAAAAELQPLLPPGTRLGYQKWSDHIAPVAITDGDTSTGKKTRVWDLQSNTEVDAVIAPVYDVSGLINGRVGQLGGKSRPAGDFLIADANPQDVLEFLSPKISDLMAPIALTLSTEQRKIFYSTLAIHAKFVGSSAALASGLRSQSEASKKADQETELSRALRAAATAVSSHPLGEIDMDLARSARSYVKGTNSVSGFVGRSGVYSGLNAPDHATMDASKPKTHTSVRDMGLGRANASSSGTSEGEESDDSNRTVESRVVYGTALASKLGFLEEGIPARKISEDAAIDVTDEVNESASGKYPLRRARVVGGDASAYVTATANPQNSVSQMQVSVGDVNPARAVYSNLLGANQGSVRGLHEYYQVGPRTASHWYLPTQASVPFRFVPKAVSDATTGLSNVQFDLAIGDRKIAKAFAQLAGDRAKIEYLRQVAIDGVRNSDALMRESAALALVRNPEKFKKLSPSERALIKSWIDRPPEPEAELIDATRQLETLASLAQVVTRAEQDRFNPVEQVPEMRQKIAVNYARTRAAKKQIAAQPDRFLQLSTLVPEPDRRLYAQWLAQVLARPETDPDWDPLNSSAIQSQIAQVKGNSDSEKSIRNGKGYVSVLGQSAWKELITRAVDRGAYSVESKSKKGRAGPATRPLEWDTAPNSKTQSVIAGTQNGDRRYREKKPDSKHLISREIAHALLSGPMQRGTMSLVNGSVLAGIEIPDASNLLTPGVVEESTRDMLAYGRLLENHWDGFSRKFQLTPGSTHPATPEGRMYARENIPEPGLFARPYLTGVAKNLNLVLDANAPKTIGPNGKVIDPLTADHALAVWSAILAMGKAPNSSWNVRKLKLADMLAMELEVARTGRYQSEPAYRDQVLTEYMSKLNEGRAPKLRLNREFFDQDLESYYKKLAIWIKQHPPK